MKTSKNSIYILNLIAILNERMLLPQFISYFGAVSASMEFDEKNVTFYWKTRFFHPLSLIWLLMQLPLIIWDKRVLKFEINEHIRTHSVSFDRKQVELVQRLGYFEEYNPHIHG